jgi:hypothetical protein
LYFWSCRHGQQGVEAHVDFALPSGGDFVVVQFDVDADVLRFIMIILGADVLQGVGGWYGEVPFFVAHAITLVTAFFFFAAVPNAFGAVEEVVARVCSLVEAHIAKHEEFGFAESMQYRRHRCS